MRRDCALATVLYRTIPRWLNMYCIHIDDALYSRRINPWMIAGLASIALRQRRPRAGRVCGRWKFWRQLSFPSPHFLTFTPPRLRRGRRARQSQQLRPNSVECVHRTVHGGRARRQIFTYYDHRYYIYPLDPTSHSFFLLALITFVLLHLHIAVLCSNRLPCEDTRSCSPESERVGSLASHLTSYIHLPPPRCLRISQPPA
jgi:hypothetical protein